jgi:hypothetical protein
MTTLNATLPMPISTPPLPPPPTPTATASNQRAPGKFLSFVLLFFFQLTLFHCILGFCILLTPGKVPQWENHRQQEQQDPPSAAAAAPPPPPWPQHDEDNKDNDEDDKDDTATATCQHANSKTVSCKLRDTKMAHPCAPSLLPIQMGCEVIRWG